MKESTKTFLKSNERKIKDYAEICARLSWLLEHWEEAEDLQQLSALTEIVCKSTRIHNACLEILSVCEFLEKGK